MVVASATEAWSTEITGGVEAPCMARCVLTEMLGDTTPNAANSRIARQLAVHGIQ